MQRCGAFIHHHLGPSRKRYIYKTSIHDNIW